MQTETDALQCAITGAQLRWFRNYDQLDLTPGQGLVVLTGENGAGKTNFLEALSLFAPGRGMRRAAIRDLGARQNEAVQTPPWAVSIRLTRQGLQHQLGTGLDPAAASGGKTTERRVIRIDGQSVRGQRTLPDYLSLVWLTPAMDGLFLGPSADRRGFLDQLVLAIDSAHSSELAAYSHSLRERAKLLKQAAAAGRSADASWLSGLEDSMARHGVAIAAARNSLIAQLQPLLEEGFDAFPTALIALDGQLEAQLHTARALEVEDRFRQTLERQRSEDGQTGRTATGPHRTDLKAWHSSHGRAAETCSTGEQKALLVALLLAHSQLIRTRDGLPPVLLLDEVGAHFDSYRRDALFAALESLKVQAFMTGTEPERFAAVRQSACFLHVSDGTITQEG